MAMVLLMSSKIVFGMRGSGIWQKDSLSQFPSPPTILVCFSFCFSQISKHQCGLEDGQITGKETVLNRVKIILLHWNFKAKGRVNHHGSIIDNWDVCLHLGAGLQSVLQFLLSITSLSSSLLIQSHLPLPWQKFANATDRPERALGLENCFQIAPRLMFTCALCCSISTGYKRDFCTVTRPVLFCKSLRCDNFYWSLKAALLIFLRYLALSPKE